MVGGCTYCKVPGMRQRMRHIKKILHRCMPIFTNDTLLTAKLYKQVPVLLETASLTYRLAKVHKDSALAQIMCPMNVGCQQYIHMHRGSYLQFYWSQLNGCATTMFPQCTLVRLALQLKCFYVSLYCSSGRTTMAILHTHIMQQMLVIPAATFR